MRIVTSSLLFLALSGSCSSSSDDNTENAAPDAMEDLLFDASTGPDAMPSQVADAMPSAAGLPSWMLEDIQPLSPRFGETYGMGAIEDKILVAVLVQGF